MDARMTRLKVEQHGHNPTAGAWEVRSGN